MSIIDLNQLIGLPLLDSALAESGAGTVRPEAGGSFDDYLQRAQYPAAGNGSNNPSGNAGQPSSPRADESQPATAQTREQNKDRTDDANDANSAGNENNSACERRQASSDEPEEKSISRANKGEDDDRDLPQADARQNAQITAQINSGAVAAANSSTAAEDCAMIKMESEDVLNPLQAAVKNAKTKTTAGQVAATETEAPAANAPQTADAEKEASIAVSANGKTSITAALGDGKKAEASPAQGTAETAPVDKKGRYSGVKTWKGNSTQSRDGQGKIAPQGENGGQPAAGVADAVVSSAALEDASAGVLTAGSAALQAGINAPPTPIASADDKIDALKAGAVLKDKSANPVNASLRLEQSAGKTTAAATQGKGEETRPQVDGARFMQRVERAFAAMSEGGGTIRLKLSPPELGSVRVEITVSKGAMKARLETETKEAKNLLLENLPALRERLAQQNVKIQKFDVDLRDPSSGGMSQQTTDQAETGSSGSGYRPPQPPSKENSAATEPASAGSAFVADHSGQLNVIV
jgi:flagellar hook-length control protein FliK